MGCENVVSSIVSTVKASRLLAVDSQTTPCRKEEITLYMFTLDADCRESQVNNEALLHDSTQQKDMSFRENETVPSSSSLCSHALVKPRNSTKRAASLDFLEKVLPYEDIAQLGCKSGKSLWKNLRCWQRTKKTVGICRSVASCAQQLAELKLGGQRPKVLRVKREILGPLYTDGSSLDSGLRGSNQQHPVAKPVYVCPASLPACCIVDAPLSGKCDGAICPYIPLNRCPRIPSAPLYLP